MLKKTIFFAILASLTISSGLQAQWTWVPTSSPPIGVITSFAEIGSNLFAGSPISGMYRTTDDGANWLAIDSGLPNSGSGGTYSIYVSGLITIGTNLFAIIDTSSGQGFSYVYLSTDSGASWNEASAGLPAPVRPGFPVSILNRFAAIGLNLFVGSDAFPYPPYGYGVFLSTNNGTSWTSAGLKNFQVVALAAIGTNLFAATWRGIGPSVDNVFLSTNNGISWTEADTGLSDSLGVTCFASIGSNIFAGTNGGGIYLSTNNGSTWASASIGLNNLYVLSLLADSSNLIAGTGGGIFLSADSGKSWQFENRGLKDIDAIWALDAFDSNIYAGVAGDTSTIPGVWRMCSFLLTLDEQLPTGSIGDTVMLSACRSNFSFISQYTGTCTYATLDSIFISGLDTNEYQISHTSHSAGAGTPDTSWIIVSPAQAGIRTITVAARYIDDENNVLDTSFTLTLDVTPSQSLSVYLKPAQLSDTSQGIVPIPIYATSATGVTSDSISFRLNLRTDLLTPVSITSPVPGAVVSFGAVDDSGVSVTLVFPPGFSILADTLVATIDCQVFVTDTNATAITVVGSSPSGSGTNCLSITDSGVETFVLNPECSDPTLIQFLQTGSLPSMMRVFPNPATNTLNLVSPTGTISISDPLGRSYAVPRNGNEMDISTLPSGVYFVSDGVNRAKFVKE